GRARGTRERVSRRSRAGSRGSSPADRHAAARSARPRIGAHRRRAREDRRMSAAVPARALPVRTAPVRHAGGFWSCFLIAVGAMRRRPWLTLAFLLVTASQGAMQGLLIWTLRNVLMAFSDPERQATAMVTGAGLILGVWLLRSGTALASEMLSISLASRVELEACWDALARL